MGSNSKIPWTDHTLNLWKGCTGVSAGCDNCYMYRDAKRYGWDPSVVTRCGKLIWQYPQHHERHGGFTWAPGDRVFVCSWSDFFHKDADQWRDEAWAVIRGRPDLQWILTTKRIERAYGCLPNDFTKENYPNVMFMPTCENQKMADKRIPPALEIKTKYPWVLIGVSIEPMLGAIDISDYLGDYIGAETCSYGEAHRNKTCDCLFGGLDQVIVGGESGPGARPMHPDWPRGIRDQCKAVKTGQSVISYGKPHCGRRYLGVRDRGVPFFFKQWGAWKPCDKKIDCRACDLEFRTRRHSWSTGKEGCSIKVTKKKAGRLLDGLEWSEYPK